MNRKSIYRIYENEDMILRDCLAADRTLLANERTYLAYLRTMVGLLAAGIGLIKYLDGSLMVQLLGWLFIIGSIVTFYYGTKRFLGTKYPLKRLLGKVTSRQRG